MFIPVHVRLPEVGFHLASKSEVKVTKLPKTLRESDKWHLMISVILKNDIVKKCSPDPNSTVLHPHDSSVVQLDPAAGEVAGSS